MAVNMNSQATPLQTLRKNPRQIFVAYPYKIYDKNDYRRPYNDVAKTFGVEFVFADAKISDLHILQKIQNLIETSKFGIYDITGWNSNVTLELGLAMGMGERAFIAFDPSKTEINEVPSDLRGIDRMQYSSYFELKNALEILIGQEIPISYANDTENQVDKLRQNAIEIVSQAGESGLGVADIAKALGISTDLAKVVIRPLVGTEFQTKGIKKGMKYFIE
ncbi:MAG: hypothetical protein LWW93_07195 [Hyphomicrobiales bacterium]|nr:hypothetical protein [Hyphomicrobiales bacterium]